MPSVQPVSARAWFVSAPASSIGSRAPWLGSAFGASSPTLRQAPAGLSALQLPEGAPLPPNTLAELRRDMARLRFVLDQIREIEAARLDQLEQHPGTGTHTMVRLLARILGVGIETADMLVHEVLSRNLRDRRAVARYAGLTGAPDESGGRR